MAGLNQALRSRKIEADTVTHQGGLGKSYHGLEELKCLALNCYLFEDTYYNSRAEYRAANGQSGAS